MKDQITNHPNIEVYLNAQVKEVNGQGILKYYFASWCEFREARWSYCRYRCPSISASISLSKDHRVLTQTELENKLIRMISHVTQ